MWVVFLMYGLIFAIICMFALCYVLGFSHGREEGVRVSTAHFGKLFAKTVREWLMEDFRRAHSDYP